MNDAQNYHAEGAHPSRTGILRWITTTNHKDIGTMYLVFSFIMLFIGGAFAMVIRAELFQPGMQIVQAETFNMLTTMHGLIMIFGFIMPVFVRACQLDDSFNDRRARYGLAADQQLELLAITRCRNDITEYDVYARRRS